jgi:hypothetical protein
MTRLELLRLLISQARANGFEFRRWYVVRLGLPWTTPAEAVSTLVEERRYYALLFSHEFAASFWKAGRPITFQVPPKSFTRKMADGTIGIVQRKGYIRRSARQNAWLYHLREMAASEDPLRYMRRYLRVMEDLDHERISALPADETGSKAHATRELLEPVLDDADHAATETAAIAPDSEDQEHHG